MESGIYRCKWSFNRIVVQRRVESNYEIAQISSFPLLRINNPLNVSSTISIPYTKQKPDDFNRTFPFRKLPLRFLKRHHWVYIDMHIENAMNLTYSTQQRYQRAIQMYHGTIELLFKGHYVITKWLRNNYVIWKAFYSQIVWFLCRRYKRLS